MPAVRLADDVLRRIVRARERMHDESDRLLRVSELARQACLSEQHFVRLFRAAYGCTPGQYLGRVRMNQAKRLLAQGTSVTEVCFSVGYASLGTFSHRFALATSLSPRAFQRQMRGFGSCLWNPADVELFSGAALLGVCGQEVPCLQALTGCCQ